MGLLARLKQFLGLERPRHAPPKISISKTPLPEPPKHVKVAQFVISTKPVDTARAVLEYNDREKAAFLAWYWRDKEYLYLGIYAYTAATFTASILLGALPVLSQLSKNR